MAGWFTVFSPLENREIGPLCLLGSWTRDYSRFKVPDPEVGGEGRYWGLCSLLGSEGQAHPHVLTSFLEQAPALCSRGSDLATGM